MSLCLSYVSLVIQYFCSAWLFAVFNDVAGFKSLVIESLKCVV